MSMKVEVFNNTNDDLSVVNVARVSFNKYQDFFDKEKDVKLINYLAKHKHISPFFHQRFTFLIPTETWKNYMIRAFPEHLMGFVWEYPSYTDFTKVRGSFYGWITYLDYVSDLTLAKELKRKMPYSYEAFVQSGDGHDIETSFVSGEAFPHHDAEVDPLFVDVSLRIHVPIFVARQLFTHRMFATNEVSRRYVDAPPEFYVPNCWRKRPESGIKQGSSEECIENQESKYRKVLNTSVDVYTSMLEDGVAPEMARMSLPQSMMTTIIFTGTVHHWYKMYKLRSDYHAQKEIREVAGMIMDNLQEIPVDWSLIM